MEPGGHAREVVISLLNNRSGKLVGRAGQSQKILSFFCSSQLCSTFTFKILYFMKAIAIIPARYASSRFPGKPIVHIGSKTMIQRVYERAKMVPELDDVIVATDDERIIDNITSVGGKAVMTATTHQSGTERCAEVLENMEEQPDIVLDIQGDVPFIELSHIQLVLNSFRQESTQIASLYTPINDLATLSNPNAPKVVFDNDFNAIYFSRSPIPYLRDVEKTDWPASFRFYKHIGVYGFRSEILKEVVKLPVGRLEKAENLEQLRWIEHGYKIHLSETDVESLAIDTHEDLSRVLAKMQGDRYLHEH